LREQIGRRLRELIVGPESPAGEQGRHRPGVGAILAVLVLVIASLGVIDYLTGPVLSLVLLYSIPTAIGAAVAGRSAGLALAAGSTVAQTVAGLLYKDPDQVVVGLNGLALLATGSSSHSSRRFVRVPWHRAIRRSGDESSWPTPPTNSARLWRACGLRPRPCWSAALPASRSGCS